MYITHLKVFEEVSLYVYGGGGGGGGGILAFVPATNYLNTRSQLKNIFTCTKARTVHIYCMK